MPSLRLTPIVKTLLIIYLVIFLLQNGLDQYFGTDIVGTLSLVPFHVIQDYWIWQILTYSFLHGDVSHLFLNGLVLVFTGSQLEMLWGKKLFLKYYFFCVGFAGLCYLVLQIFFTHSLYSPLVGASGGLFGLIMAYGILYGDQNFYYSFIIPMKARHLAFLLVGFELLTLLFSPYGKKLSAIAHLGGGLGGFIYLKGLTWFQLRGGGPFKWFRKKKHLRLVVNETEGRRPKNKKDTPTWH